MIHTDSFSQAEHVYRKEQKHLAGYCKRALEKQDRKVPKDSDYSCEWLWTK